MTLSLLDDEIAAQSFRVRFHVLRDWSDWSQIEHVALVWLARGWKEKAAKWRKSFVKSRETEVAWSL
jgi:hypothetical protein